MRNLGTLAAAVTFLAVAALWAVRTQSVLNIPAELDRADRWGMEDYRDAGYYPARAMLEGVNPYHTTQFLESYPVRQVFPLYSPAVLLVNLPFALLPLHAAQSIFFIVSVLLIPVLALVVLLSTGLDVGAARVFWLSAFITAGRPMYSNLTLGQSAIFIAIGVLMALHYARERPILGGIGLAIATLKPTFGVPLVLLMFFRKDYRALVIGIGIGAIAALIPALILTATAGGLNGWLEAVPDNLRHFNSHPANALDTESWGRIDAAVALVRLFGVPLFAGFGLAVAAVGLGSASSVVHRLSRLELERGAYSLSSVIICFAVLVSVFHQSYDALIVALPLVLVATARLEPWSQVARPIRLTLVLLLAGLWFNYLTTNVGLNAAGLEPWTTGWRVATSLNSLALICAFGITLGVALRVRQTPFETGTRE